MANMVGSDNNTLITTTKGAAASKTSLSDVDQIKVQVAKLMKQLNDLKVSKRTKRLGTKNPEEGQDSDNNLELDL